ncbi:MAG: hypothetical protein Q8O95_02080 [bacterium]|nr:hypothetical protein [bacterium]
MIPEEQGRIFLKGPELQLMIVFSKVLKTDSERLFRNLDKVQQALNIAGQLPELLMTRNQADFIPFYTAANSLYHDLTSYHLSYVDHLKSLGLPSEDKSLEALALLLMLISRDLKPDQQRTTLDLLYFLVEEAEWVHGKVLKAQGEILVPYFSDLISLLKASSFQKGIAESLKISNIPPLQKEETNKSLIIQTEEHRTKIEALQVPLSRGSESPQIASDKGGVSSPEAPKATQKTEISVDQKPQVRHENMDEGSFNFQEKGPAREFKKKVSSLKIAERLPEELDRGKIALANEGKDVVLTELIQGYTFPMNCLLPMMGKGGKIETIVITGKAENRQNMIDYKLRKEDGSYGASQCMFAIPLKNQLCQAAIHWDEWAAQIQKKKPDEQTRRVGNKENMRAESQSIPTDLFDLLEDASETQSVAESSGESAPSFSESFSLPPLPPPPPQHVAKYLEWEKPEQFFPDANMETPDASGETISWPEYRELEWEKKLVPGKTYNVYHGEDFVGVFPGEVVWESEVTDSSSRSLSNVTMNDEPGGYMRFDDEEETKI